MSAAFIAAAQAELAFLEDDLAHNPDPRTVKMERLRGLIALYKEGGRAAPEGEPTPPSAFVRSPKPAAQPRQTDPKRERILKAAEEVVSAVGGPVKTAEIFQWLSAEVIADIPGKDPKSNLSAMMHNSKRFRSHGREGWSLPAEHQAPTKDTPPDDRGEFEVNTLN